MSLLRLKQLNRKRRTSGQVALEYFMMTAFMVLLATYFNIMLSNSEEGSNDNAIQQSVEPAYGNALQMGTIGRPYP